MYVCMQLHVYMYISTFPCTVPLNYNFIFARVDMRGNTLRVCVDHVSRGVEHTYTSRVIYRVLRVE